VADRVIEEEDTMTDFSVPPMAFFETHDNNHQPQHYLLQHPILTPQWIMKI
jgi:hypothetical protein